MNKKQVEDLEQCGVFMEQMFHTLACYDSSTYKEFLSDMSYDERNFKLISGNLTDDVLVDNEDNLSSLLLDYDLYGFIAEFRIPNRTNFKFKSNGEFQSCSVNYGTQTMFYVFGQTIDILIDKAVEFAKKYRKREENKAKQQVLEL